ncbi:MAG: alpha/beta hydrolase [Propionibacteriaceae bacterium]|jgi:alpha-beta hydrolase superfamily lysophospholipase|nr:alpha/beta hydrolase [Propionibacteriaceae bacterium]
MSDEPDPRSGLASLISSWRHIWSRAGLAQVDPVDHSDSPTDHWLADWQADVLLPDFQMRQYELCSQPHLPEEGAGHLRATLVRRHSPRHRRAVLYIHGWNEYFFQAHVAAVFDELGFDFFAIDLHRYGRSLQDGELPGYMTDVRDYFPELDAVVAEVRRDHDQVLLYGHSTGGLIAALYANDRPHKFIGVMLNSPWIDLQGSALFRALTPPLMRGLAMATPTMALPLSENDLYGRSLHRDYQGEWDYDLNLKRISSQPIRPGWTRAVVNAQDRVGSGLHIDAPVLVVTSSQSSAPKTWGPLVTSTDLAIDVERVAARAYRLGWHVTLVRLVGALHDVSLSSAQVRRRFFDEIRRWVAAYLA